MSSLPRPRDAAAAPPRGSPAAGAAAPADLVALGASGNIAERDGLTFLPEPAPALLVPTRGGVVRIPIARIEWLEAERDYVRLHGLGKAHLVRARFSELCRALEAFGFRRIHRGAAVNARAILHRFRSPAGDLRVALRDGRELRVGRSYAAALRRAAPARRRPGQH